MAWQHEILRQLEAEPVNNEYIEDYNNLLDRFLASEKKISMLQSTESQVQLQSQLTLNESLQRELNAANAKISTFETEVKTLNAQIKTQKRQIKDLTESQLKLKEQSQIQAEENKGKSKALGMVNDEILALQLENNLLNEKIKRLEQENDHLVVRWMNKVKEDVERLNDANEFLSMARGEK